MNQQGQQSARLYVGGVAPSVQQKDVEDLFGKYGKILEVRLNRNFAFVQYSDESEAQEAIKEINGTSHFGRRLDVQVARYPKTGPGGKEDAPSRDRDRDGRDRSPIGGGGSGRGGFGGRDRGGNRGGFGGRDRGGGFGGRGGDRGDIRDRFDDSPFGGPGGGRDFRGRDDFRGGDFPPSRGSDNSSFREGGLFGSSGGREFSLAPPSGFRGGNMRDDPPASKWGRDTFGSGLNDKAFDSRPPPRDLPPVSNYDQRAPTHPAEPISVANNDRTNDIEIIIVDKSLTEYGEMIERRLCSLGFSVDVLFPHAAVPLERVLGNIASRGTLYAVVITHVHQINGSLTLHILHGRPQEHRNMAIDDAVTLLLRNYEAYTKSCKEKSGPNTPPEQVRHLMNQVLNGRALTSTQYDILVQFLLQEKLKLEPQQGPADSQNTSAQAELQTRILSILNKTPANNEMMQQPPPPIQPAGPLLQDPSVQKALDSLIQGGDILRKLAPQQPTAPFGRF